MKNYKLKIKNVMLNLFQLGRCALKATLLFAICYLLFSVVYAGNLLTNPGFEAAVSNWVVSPEWLASETNAYGAETSTRHAGGYSLFVTTEPAISDNYGLYQNVAVTPNVRYNLAGWVWNNSITDIHTGLGLCSGGGGFYNVAPDVSNSTTTTKNSTQWQFLNMSTQIPQGVANVGVNAYIRMNPALTTSYFDDLYFGIPSTPSVLSQFTTSSEITTMQWTNSAVIITSFTQSGSAAGNLKFHLQVSSVTTADNPDWSIVFLNYTSAFIPEGTTNYQLPGLTDNGTYWWRVWSEDINGVTSSTSTILHTGSVAKFGFDNKKPAGISDLTTSISGVLPDGAIKLSWTAPGDDENTGQIINGRWEIKYSSIGIITNTNYDNPPNPTYTVSIDTTNINPLFTISYLITGLIPATTYWFAIKTSDKAGNWSVWNSSADVPTVNTSAYARAKDATLPTVKITYPTNNLITNNLTTISGTANDNISVSDVQITIRNLAKPSTYWNGATWVSSAVWLPCTLHPSSWTYTAPDWVSGSSYTIVAKSKDSFDNWSTAYSTATFTYDNTLPGSVVVYPANGSEISSLSVISGTASDNVGIANVQITIQRVDNSQYWTGGGWSYSETWLTVSSTCQWQYWQYTGLTTVNLLHSASYLVVSRAQDTAGNTEVSTTGQSQFTYRDTILPAAISDLTALTGPNEGEIILKWTAPGDDGTLYGISNGQYIIKYSPTAIIKRTNFEIAPNELLISTSYPTALVLHTRTLTGLTGGTSYWFAIKTTDEANNTSVWNSSADVSGVNTGAYRNAQVDFTAPAKITTLKSQPGTKEGEVLLTWTATGDDGTVNTVYGQYQVIYSTHITMPWYNSRHYSTYWSTTTQAMEKQSRIMTGLVPNLTYVFWVRLYDDRNNVNGEVDQKSTTCQPQIDNIQPAQTTDLTALGGPNEGEIILRWTAPGDDGTVGTITNGKFEIRYSASDPNLSTFLPIYLSTSSVIPLTTRYYTITGLVPGTTYWFALKTQDDIPNTSSISNTASASATDFVPSAPQTLVAVAGNYRIILNWQANPEIDISGYNVYRAKNPGGPYSIIIKNVSNNQYDDVLTGVGKYYYVVTALDLTGHESSYSNETSTISFARLPLAPAGVKGTLNNNGSFTITWSSVTKNIDGTNCDDIIGYNIYSARALSGPWVKQTMVDKNTLNWTDTQINSGLMYYLLRTVIAAGVESENAIIINTLAGNDFVMLETDEQNNSVVELNIPQAVSKILIKAENQYNEDIIIDIDRKEYEENTTDIYVYEFRAIKAETNEPIDNFVFPEPVELAFYYTPDKLAKLNISTATAKNQLALYWHNSVAWTQIGGTVDTTLQKVSIHITHLSKYKLAQAQRTTSFGSLQIVPPKIFTPNNDDKWNIIEFFFENPEKLSVTGKIYDITGAFVSDLKIGSTDNSLLWDGNYADGEKAPSGVYIYQITTQQKVFNGTVVVAR